MKARLGSVLDAVLRYHRVLGVSVQIAAVVTSNAAAFLLRFDGAPPVRAIEQFWAALPWLVVVRALVFVPFRLYQGLWRYTSLYDLKMLAAGIGTSSLVLAALVPVAVGSYPRSVIIIDAILLLLLLGGLRLSRRVIAELSRRKEGQRILVFGAGAAGEQVVREMKRHVDHGYQPIGFVDDDVEKRGRRIHGVPVLGTRLDLERILAVHKPQAVLIAIPGAEPQVTRAIVRALERFTIPIKTLPSLRDLIDGKTRVEQIRGLAVEDLLARAPIGLDRRPLQTLIAGRRVMVTGAGGSIGSELCRQIVALDPASIVLFERYENSLHAIRLELDDLRGGVGIHAVVGDIGDTVRVRDVMRAYAPEIVFHAAAHKHVPLMEESPCEAIKNNVRGTRIVAEAAEACGVDRVILISTDKAVNPTNVMGASKRIAELVVLSRAAGSATAFSIVRFGNVLGSNGSVIPRFLEQIRKGGPVTVTDPRMRRFFMLIPEAAQLVLHAAAQAQSGATYVLEMGEQVKLLDMARDLIRLSGFVPEDEIPIEFVGLRPGEKLYEELVGTDEVAGPSPVEKILRVTSRCPPPPDIMIAIRQLEALADAGDTPALWPVIRQLVPGFGGNAPTAETTVPAVTPASPVIREPVRVEEPGAMCPSCGSTETHRSRARGMFERIQRQMRSDLLFRCTACGWRGWQIPFEVPMIDVMTEPPPPNLDALDEPRAFEAALTAPSGFRPKAD